MPAKHPNMAERLADARVAVEAPDFARRDALRAHGENHYRRPAPGAAWIKVVVHYRPIPPQGTWVGEVITAYPTDHVGSKEGPLWP